MADVTLEVQPRQDAGKNANRKLRAQGLVPAVVYGAGARLRRSRLMIFET